MWVESSSVEAPSLWWDELLKKKNLEMILNKMQWVVGVASYGGVSFVVLSWFLMALLCVRRRTGTQWSAAPQSSRMTEPSASGTPLQSTTSSASRWAEEGSMWCCLRYLPWPLPLQTRWQSPSLWWFVREGENGVCCQQKQLQSCGCTGQKGTQNCLRH